VSIHLDAALDAAGRGWPAFPLAAGSKLPAIPSAHPSGDSRRGKCRGDCGRDGHGLYDASTDPKRLAAWWERWPRANVGLRTGVAFDVLDVDVKQADGIATLVALLDAHGCLPPGGSVATPSGGLHFYFAATGEGNKAGFAPGLDWRGAGGYVVAPPSAIEGNPYEWGHPPDIELPGPPPWLLALLRPTMAPSAARAAIVGRSASSYGRRALEAEVGRLAMAREGARNAQLNASAFALGQLVVAGSLDAREVVEALATVAERIGLAPGEIEKSLASGLQAGMAQPRRLPA